jgi:flagellar protein FlgJ
MVPTTPAAASGRESPDKVRKAAEDFEALIVAQMIKSVRESALGTWSDPDQSGAVGLEMAEQQLAQVIASQGGLGLARMIERSLPAAPTTPDAPANSSQQKTSTLPPFRR